MSITLHDAVGLSSSRSPLRGRASSIAIILLGSIWYTWIKHLESQAAKPHYEPVALDEMEKGKSPQNGNGNGHAHLHSQGRDARD